MARTPKLSIDLNSRRLSAILYTVEKKTITINDSLCLAVNAQEELLDTLDRLIRHFSVSEIPCFLGLSPEYFFFKSLEFPFSDKKQIASVLTYELQDSVILSADDYISDYLFHEKPDNRTGVLAILLKKDFLRKLLNVFRDNKLDPEIVSVSGIAGVYNHCRSGYGGSMSFVFLDVGFTHANIWVVNNGRVNLIRSIPFDPAGKAAVTVSEGDDRKVLIGAQANLPAAIKEIAGRIHNTVVAVRTEEQDLSSVPWFISGEVGTLPQVKTLLFQELKMAHDGNSWFPYDTIINLEDRIDREAVAIFGNALAAASCKSKDLEIINFRKDAFACTQNRRKAARLVKTILICGGIFAAILVCGLTVEFRQLKSSRDRVADEIVSIYQATIPGDPRIVNPVRQLREKVNELKSPTSTGSVDTGEFNAVILLNDISARISPSLNVTFERYIYDRKMIRIKGLTDNFNTVDQMKRALEESPFFREVAIVTANVTQKDNGVRFELKLLL